MGHKRSLEMMVGVFSQGLPGEAVLMLSQELPTGKLPDVIQVVPLGKFYYSNPEFTKGKVVECNVTRDTVAAMIAAKDETDIVVDYEHQTLKDIEAPAAAWAYELIDGGERGLLAKLKWTAKAAERVRNGEYRYVSPVVVFNFPSKTEPGKKHLAVLHSVALTNRPYLPNIEPLVAKGLPGPIMVATKATQSQEDSKMKKLITWLVATMGVTLDENATEAQVLAALKQAYGTIATALGVEAESSIEKVGTAVAALKQSGDDDMAAGLKLVREALGLKEGDGVSTITGTIAALKQGSDQTTDLAAQVAKLTQDIATKNAGEAVAAALKDGKISVAQKEWAKKYATTDPEGFKAFVAKAPAVVPVKKVAGADEPVGGEAALDEPTMAVAKMFGNSEDDLKEHGGVSA